MATFCGLPCLINNQPFLAPCALSLVLFVYTPCGHQPKWKEGVYRHNIHLVTVLPNSPLMKKRQDVSIDRPEDGQEQLLTRPESY